ncbi:MAG: prop effector [Hylemonella sp.]|nr:prop effector [Hylemonella sp.]
MTEIALEAPVSHPVQKPQAPRPKTATPKKNSVLVQLADLYPALFGETPVPLKRGIFQDLQTAHPEVFEREALKTALGLHTRSTRYLNSVAAGTGRHDLSMQVVEAMAPLHTFQALAEVYRRKHQRTGKDVRRELHNRIAQAFDASGMTQDSYAALVLTRDDALNGIVNAALAEAAERGARDEALLRAFDAGTATEEAFAEMYGLSPAFAQASLARARAKKAATSS